METVIPMSRLAREDRISLLRRLGYDVEGTKVIRDGQPYTDPCTGTVVDIDNMMILPGSAIVLDQNEASIAWYAANYVE